MAAQLNNNSNMLRLAALISFNVSSNFSKLAMLKHSAHVKQLLGKRVNKQHQVNHILKHLQQIKKKNHQLEQHFSNKPVSDFSLEEIYFYLTNKQMFSTPNKLVHFALITNPNLDAYSCFVVAFNNPLLADDQYQTKLIKSFNEGCILMKCQEIAYCLRVMKKFNINIIDKHLNYEAIRLRINYAQQAADFGLLQILLQLKDLAPLSKLINLAQTKLLIQKLGAEVAKISAGIKHYYILSKIQPIFTITQTKNIISLRQKQVQKKIILAKSIEQLQYCIKILQSYKQFINLVKIQKMPAQLYIKYLQFILMQVKLNSNFVVLYHQIPLKAAHQSTNQQFYEIIRLRMELGLQKQHLLGKMVKRIMSYDLQSVFGLVRYLKQNNIDQLTNPRPWIDFEEGFVKALQLNNAKKRDLVKIAKEEDVVKIFKVLAYMSTNRLGSSIFWKHCNHFVHDFLMNQNLVKKIGTDDQNNFLISAFSIYGIKSIPQHVEKKLVNLSLVALTNNKWPISQLYRFTKCLTFAKFGKDQIWYGIQNKLMQAYISKHSDQQSKMKMGYIVQYFNQMNLGSFKFKNKMARFQQSGLIIKPSLKVQDKTQEMIKFQQKMKKLEMQGFQN